jgi:hypothetical protein
MTFIKNRLRRLESPTRKGPSGWCPACGLPPYGPARIVYERIPEDAEEVCLVCGRRLWFVIEVAGVETSGGRGEPYWPVVAR